MYSSAARTNLTSQRVEINEYHLVGEGHFRMVYGGTYIGGTRNQQEAVCKCFKWRFEDMEEEYYSADFKIAERAIRFAEEWNQMCQRGNEIQITYGSIMKIGGKKYLVEPLIRDFTKFTSNAGWIADRNIEVQALEAFAHYTYHRSGGQMIVCDLQGRYRYNKSRFELTDPAICSQHRNYGPTDLGEKGIHSFFARHKCNEYCHWGGHWQSPRNVQNWFLGISESTQMMSMSSSEMLQVHHPARFTSNLEPVYDDEDEADY